MDQTTLINGMYPTIFDYEDSANINGMTVIDEITGQSDLVLDACVIPTNSGFRHEFKREIEKKYNAKAAAFDEGWVASGGTRTMMVSVPTMRITDAKEFDILTERMTSDGGAARRARNIRNLGDSLIHEKANQLLYGGLPHPDGNFDAKEIPGFASYVDKISDYDAMIQRWENEECPFEDENCLALDNQDGSNTTDSATVESDEANKVWTSIYGFAFGEKGAFTTFPSNLAMLAGYKADFFPEQLATYQDKRDGLTKYRTFDLVTGECAFGVGVANRFCLTALRNIYLKHKTKDDIFDEMYRVEQNLIKLADFFSLGKVDGVGQMTFYTNRYLIHQMAQYQQNRIVRVDMGNNSNKGNIGDTTPAELEIAPGLILKSDFAIKRTEAFIA